MTTVYTFTRPFGLPALRSSRRPRAVSGVLPVLLLLAALVGSAPALHAQTTGRIEGTVRDAVRGLPGVTVVLVGTAKGAGTDLGGAFAIDGVVPGTYEVRATLLGFETARQTVAVAAGATASVDFTLAEGAISLDEVTVRGESFVPRDAAATANVVSAEQIRRFAGDNPLRLIENVPGMDLGAYRQGGTADVFSIRGFGGGGHGGDAAVQIDGIPLNEADGHADGYADLNVLVPLELQRVVVYKGPSSALFGNFARGGTIALDTRRGGQYADASLSGGAYQTLDAQIALGQRIAVGGGTPLEANVAGQFYTTDGYSANSNFVKGLGSGRLSYALSGRTDVNLAVRGYRGDWSAPGYIPDAQFNSDSRNQQGPNAEDDGGDKTFFAERLGLNHTFTDRLRLVTYGYAVQQDFTRFAKFGYGAGGQSESFNRRSVFGGGASLNGQAALAGVGVNYVVGTELYSEGTDVERYSTVNRVRQSQTQSRDFLIRSASAFVQAELALSPYFRPTLAARYDDFSGTYDNADPGRTPFTNSLNDFSHFSPKLGVRSTVLPGLDLRASASNGYALPDDVAKYSPDLDGIEPVEIWQYEAGVTVVPAPGVLFDVVGYLLDTSSEILEIPAGSGTFSNFGETRRRGVEAEARVTLLAGLDAQVAVGILDTEVMQNSDAALVGTALTGLPQQTYTLTLDYTSPVGVGGRLHVHGIGSYGLTSDGAEQYGGYTVTNLTGFYDLSQRFTRFARRGRLFAEVTNLFDVNYAEAVFAAFGTLNYAPAPPRRVSVGLQVGL